MKLKILIGYVLAATLGAMFALPALAQSPQAEAELQRWISKDPRLQEDPGLMNNPTYLRNHPNFATWLEVSIPAPTNRWSGWVPTITSIDGTTPIGGIKTTPTGCLKITPNGTTTIRSGAMAIPQGPAQAPMTNTTIGTTATGGTPTEPTGSGKIITEWAAHHEERVEHRQAAVHEYVEHHAHHDNDHH